MTVTRIKCPQCETSLKSATTIAVGAKIKCPKCGGLFAYKPPDELAEHAEYADRDDVPEEKEETERPRKSLKKKKRQGNQTLVKLISVGVVVFLLTGGAVAAFVWPGFLRSRNFTDPLAYVPADSRVIFSVDVETCVDQLGLQPVLERVLTQGSGGSSAKCKEKTGLEFKELFNHLTLATSQPLQSMAGRGIAKVVLVIRSKVPFKKRKVIDLLEITEPAQKAVGETYYTKMDRGGDKSLIFFPSNRLIVISNHEPDRHWEAILKADGNKPAPGSEMMGMINVAQHGAAWVVLPADQMTTGMQAAAGSATEQPEAAAVAATLQQAKMMGLWLTVINDQAKLDVGIMCSDAGSAGRVMTDLQKYWDAQTKGAVAGMKMMAGLALLPKPLQDLARELIQGVRFATQDNMATMSTQAGMNTVRTALVAVQNLAAGLIGGAPGPGRN